MREFFHQIRMTENVENPALHHLRVGFPIMRPNGIHIALRPAAEPFRIVEIPIAEVMHRADQVVPFVTRSEIGDPVFTPGQPVALKSGTDRNPPRSVFPGALDPLEILGQIRHRHPPIVERLGHAGGMVRDAIFRDVRRQRGIDKSFRFALGMMAERRMGVVIGRHGVFEDESD